MSGVSRILLFCWMLCFLTAPLPSGAGTELHNIAVGRTYTLSPVPNYAKLTDKGDLYQLTDGERKGSYWGNAASVCWKEQKAEVTIDLGSSRTFHEVRLFTRVNAADIFIRKTEVFQGDEAGRFISIGMSTGKADTLQGNGYAGESYTIFVATPGGTGRFVRIVMEAPTFIFCDEIEVMSREQSMLSVTERVQKADGTYEYTLAVNNSSVKKVLLRCCGSENDVLLTVPARVIDGKSVCPFRLPSEASHHLFYDALDGTGTVLERCLEKISYSLPASNICPAETIELNDSGFYQVSAPGENCQERAWKPINFSEHYYPFQPFSALGNEPAVIWYRSIFSLPEDMKGKTVLLTLKRVRYAPSVYCNGKLVAQGDMEPNLPHTVDISQAVRPGENEMKIMVYDWRGLLVKGSGPFSVTGKENVAQEPWYAMTPAVKDEDVSTGKYSFIYPPGWDFYVFGILEPIQVSVFPGVHIGEIRITPSVSMKKLTVEAEILNGGDTLRSVILAGIIGDIENPGLKKIPEKNLQVRPRSSVTVRTEMTWENPELWWPGAPHLYHLASILREGRNVLETRDTRFGFREVTTHGKDMLLNGCKLHLFGVHDAPHFNGTGTDDWNFYRQYQFNVFRAWGGTSGEELLSTADEAGHLIIDEGNHYSVYVNAGQEFWDNCFLHFKRRIQRDYNHPSVIIYSTQNEYTAGTTPWARADWTAERMKEHAKRIKEYDSTRSVGTAGGTISSEDTILMPHYPAEALVSEDPDISDHLLPNNYANWLESLKGTDWMTKPLYLDEMGLAWDYRSALPDASTVYNTDDTVYRGWRLDGGFDSRATMNFLPMEIDAMRYGEITGVSPNVWGGELAGIPRSCFQPFYMQVRGYARGCYGGQPYTRHIVLYNDCLDGRREKKLEVTAVLKHDGSEELIYRNVVTVKDGEKCELPLTLTMPDVKERKEFTVAFAVEYGGKNVYARDAVYSVFPRQSGIVCKRRIVLYDSQGASAAFLNSLAIPFTAADFTTLEPAKDVLIIGKGCLDGKVTESAAAIADFVRKGGVVMALAQEKDLSWLPVPVILDTSQASTINYLRAPGHPLLQDIREDDFKFWGEDNIVCRVNYKKPVSGGFRAIVDTANTRGLLWSPLLEIPFGSGTFILCQFELERFFATEPAAGILFRNLLSYAGMESREPVVRCAVRKDMPETVKKRLTAAGITYDELEQCPDTVEAGYGLFLLEGNTKPADSELEQAGRFVREGGIVVVHRMEPSSPWKKLLPESAKIEAVRIGTSRNAVIHTEYRPLTYGLSNQQLYWLAAECAANGWQPAPDIAEYKITAADATAEVLLDPPLLVKFPSGRGFVLCDQMNWDTAAGTSKRKADEYLRILYTNLGVCVRAEVPRKISVIPVELRSFCNMGFRDDKEFDGRGGWTDQGVNDLRFLPTGSVTLRGIEFSIIDPAANGGRSCIILKSANTPWGIQNTGELALGIKAPCCYFMHASAWTALNETMAWYVIHYEDGQTIEIPVIGGRNVGEWWHPMSELPEAEIAWEGPNLQAGKVGLWLYAWKNPYPEKTIRGITIKSANGKSTLGLVAISAETLRGDK